jgi:hypothetical protein
MTATERSVVPAPPPAEPTPADPQPPVTTPFDSAPSPVPDLPPAAAGAPVVTPGRRSETDHGRTVSVLFGLVFLGFGLWFFVEQTLGYDLPNIRWSQLWPVILIIIGALVVLGSMRRGSR